MPVGNLVCGIAAMLAVAVLNNHPYFVRQRRLFAVVEDRQRLYTILLLIGVLQSVGLYCLFVAFMKSMKSQ